VVRGEGEETLLELVEKISGKGFKREVMQQIKGISFRIGKTKIHNEPRPFCDNLDSFPFPARHLLPMSKYHYFGARKYPITNIITSRGCPYNCSYCNKNIAGHKFRPRSVENIMAEIDYLVKEMGIREIHISDDTFTLDRARVHRLCKEIASRKYDLAFYPHNGVRVDTVDIDLLKDMKDAGFYSMVFGVESGNQQILNNIHKCITLDQVRTAYRLSKKLGFETWGFFIIGLNGETRKTALDTIRFAKELDPDVAKFQILVPYPGTQDYERLKGRMLVSKWSDYLFYGGSSFEPENMSTEELNSLFKLAYRSFYLRPKAIWRALKKSLSSLTILRENLKGALSVLKIISG
jgi:anaerobic magnesium-protoporphyrin IX monomethyl ester cyclase